ncbi:metallophosphatase family protein [Candidatus Woesearchaeota archaeon]|nr:metallophosphatase family protein [Candidatus Woesearchaeota archaeon]
MRYAILSDIHGNIAALEAVLGDIGEQGIGQVICLGDLVGYGPRPHDCVQRIMEASGTALMGNHDLIVASDHPGKYSGASFFAHFTLLQAEEQQLTKEDMDYLRNRPLKHNDGTIVAAHANIEEPSGFDYVLGLIRPAKELLQIFDEKVSIGFIGHTHTPVLHTNMRKLPVLQGSMGHGRYALKNEEVAEVNVGSVGQPRDRDNRACYVIYDTETRELTFRRVGYNIEDAAADYRQGLFDRFIREKHPELVDELESNVLLMKSHYDGDTIDEMLAYRLEHGK